MDLITAALKFWALVVVTGLLLGGCAPSLPANPSGMTPDQLREWVKDKNATVLCAVVSTPYKGSVVSFNLDKGIVVNGSMTIKDGCEVTITNAPPPPRPNVP